METMENVKKYEIKNLSASDLFPVMQLLKKIGIKNIFNEIDPHDFDIIFNDKEATEEEEIQVGVAVVQLAMIIIANLGTCKKEVYKILSNATGLKESEFDNMPAENFTSLVVDYIKQPSFIRVFKSVVPSLK